MRLCGFFHKFPTPYYCYFKRVVSNEAGLLFLPTSTVFINPGKRTNK